MNFTEQQTLQFRKLLKTLKLSQKALIEQCNQSGYKLDSTALSSALNQRRSLPDAYEKALKEEIEKQIAAQPEKKQTKLSTLLDMAFGEKADTSEPVHFGSEPAFFGSDEQAQQPTKPYVGVKPGIPLPAHCSHYVQRTCDRDLQDCLHQKQKLILITAAPKMGATSLLNQTEVQLQKLQHKVLRIDLLANWAPFTKVFSLNKNKTKSENNIATLAALLMFCVAQSIDYSASNKADISSIAPSLIELEATQGIERLLSLPNDYHVFSLLRDASTGLKNLFKEEDVSYLLVDNLDKLLYQQKIDFETHNNFIWLLQHEFANAQQRIICCLSPFVWAQNTHTSLSLRQASTVDSSQFEHHHTLKLYQQLETQDRQTLSEFEGQHPDINTIQDITNKLGGNPFLLHYLMATTTRHSMLQALQEADYFSPTGNSNSVQEPLIEYQKQLNNINALFPTLHNPLNSYTSIENNPFDINQLLEKLSFLNRDTFKPTLLFEISIATTESQ